MGLGDGLDLEIDEDL
jgi:hypothetical protein